MIPFGDEGTPPQRSFPIVNVTIIALNIIMYLAQVLIGDPLTNGWSLIPQEVTTGHDLIGNIPVPGLGGVIPMYAAPLGQPLLTIITSMFMHGGLLHIGSNMLFLFIFGDNVEDNFGSLKYLVFYLTCGLGATAAQIYLGGPDSVIPNLGASGAIAGVLAAYLILFRQARIRVLLTLGYFFTVTTVSAMVMIGIWIVTQVLSITVLQAQTAGGGVAYWAHVGGFISGIVLAFLFADRQRSNVRLAA
jgi:membrane associated rhomboid family serine protease